MEEKLEYLITEYSILHDKLVRLESSILQRPVIDTKNIEKRLADLENFTKILQAWFKAGVKDVGFNPSTRY